MKSRETMMVFAAAWLVVSGSRGFAQTAAASAPDEQSAASRPSAVHRAAKNRPKHTATRPPAAAETVHSSAEQTDIGERAASLERRRKAFFANKPDDNEAAGDGSAAPVGFTLGGSGGLKPEMGMKF